MDETEDPVVAEHNVYVSTQLAPYLHILQAPANMQELASRTGSTTGRYKKNHKLLEVQLPLDTAHSTYSRTRGEELAMASAVGRVRSQGTGLDNPVGAKLDSICLAGAKVALGSNSKYFVAVSLDGALNLTPVDTMISMKPSLHYLDDSDAKTRSTVRRLEADPPNEEKQQQLKAVQIQFKKRETEEQAAARLSSFAYLQRQVEEEPWTTLTHYAEVSSESQTVRERLLSTSNNPIEFAS